MKNILTAMILVFLLSACSSSYLVEPTPEILFIIPTPVVPTATPTATVVPPTFTPPPIVSPTPGPFHLNFGYFDREPACVAITEMVFRLLEQEVEDVALTKVEYDRRSNALYDVMAARTVDQEIDLTLCFFDPTDRIYLRLFINELKQIGATVWEDEEQQVRMLIIANQKSHAKLKNERPCLYRFFQQLEFGDLPVDELEAERWLSTHRDEVEAWLTCQEISPNDEEG